MSATRKRLRGLPRESRRGSRVIVIAHSQGNLLVNLSYAMLAAKYGNAVAKQVRVVNVANTSGFSISNLNLTHAGDAALFSGGAAKRHLDNSLETLPSQEGWTRTTPTCPNDQACNFRLARATLLKPTSAITDQGVIDKVLDHSIVETYLSSATVPVANGQGIPFSASATRFRDRFEDAVYAAAASLEASQGAPSSSTVVAQTLRNRLASNAISKKSFESLFAGQTNLDSWLVRHVKDGDGVESPAKQCAIGDKCFEYYSACQPHNCYDNHIHVFFDASGMAASALYINNDSGTSRIFGTPDHKLRSAMEVVESWEGMWPKPKCEFK